MDKQTTQILAMSYIKEAKINNEQDALSLIEAISDKQNGILLWVQKHW